MVHCFTFRCRCSTLHVSAYMAIFRCVWCFTFIFLKESASLFLLPFFARGYTRTMHGKFKTCDVPHTYRWGLSAFIGRFLHSYLLENIQKLYFLTPTNIFKIKDCVKWTDIDNTQIHSYEISYAYNLRITSIKKLRIYLMKRILQKWGLKRLLKVIAKLREVAK
jgi:hypothetical protein